MVDNRNNHNDWKSEQKMHVWIWHSSQLLNVKFGSTIDLNFCTLVQSSQCWNVLKWIVTGTYNIRLCISQSWNKISGFLRVYRTVFLEALRISGTLFELEQCYLCFFVRPYWQWPIYKCESSKVNTIRS